MGGGKSPHQHSVVISCTAQDMPQLNGELNCSGEHYLRKVPRLLLDRAISAGVSPMIRGSLRGASGGRERGCNDDSHRRSIASIAASAQLSWEM